MVLALASVPFARNRASLKENPMIRSLRNIKPISTSHHVGEKRVLVSSEESGCNITQIAVTDLRAGEVSAAHVHADMQEAFFVLDGELEATLSDENGGEHIELFHKDDFLYVDAGTSHELRAITDVRILTIGCVIVSEEVKPSKSFFRSIIGRMLKS